MVYRPSVGRLQAYIEAANFIGYDPYDALNSPVLRALSFRRKSLRILFIQLLKRLPVNPRPFLFIKKGYNPKGLGLFLWGYAKPYAIGRGDGGFLCTGRGRRSTGRRSGD
jgi:hypothetical protein